MEHYSSKNRHSRKSIQSSKIHEHVPVKRQIDIPTVSLTVITKQSSGRINSRAHPITCGQLEKLKIHIDLLRRDGTPSRERAFFPACHKPDALPLLHYLRGRRKKGLVCRWRRSARYRLLERAACGPLGLCAYEIQTRTLVGAHKGIS